MEGQVGAKHLWSQRLSSCKDLCMLPLWRSSSLCMAVSSVGPQQWPGVGLEPPLPPEPAVMEMSWDSQGTCLSTHLCLTTTTFREQWFPLHFYLLNHVQILFLTNSYYICFFFTKQQQQQWKKVLFFFFPNEPITARISNLSQTDTTHSSRACKMCKGNSKSLIKSRFTNSFFEWNKTAEKSMYGRGHRQRKSGKQNPLPQIHQHLEEC